jgi:hypothetical protein
MRGWTFQRWAYLVLGLIMMVSSIIDRFWVGILFGAYFAAMGLFAFGCASGNCNPSTVLPDSQTEREK